MPTLTKHPESSRRTIPAPALPPVPAQSPKALDGEPPVRLKTRAEVRAYLAAHAKPVRHGPKGQPIYAQEDIAKRNVLFRDDAY